MENFKAPVEELCTDLDTRPLVPDLKIQFLFHDLSILTGPEEDVTKLIDEGEQLLKSRFGEAYQRFINQAKRRTMKKIF